MSEDSGPAPGRSVNVQPVVIISVMFLSIFCGNIVPVFCKI